MNLSAQQKQEVLALESRIHVLKLKLVLLKNPKPYTLYTPQEQVDAHYRARVPLKVKG